MLLGGDHAMTGPIVSAFADHYGPGTVAAVQLDAHTDTAPIPEGHMGNHGTQMRELIETGAIRGPHLIQLAIRGGWPDPAVTGWMEDAGVRTHYMAEIFRHGFDAVLDDAIAEAKRSGAEHVFLTLDIDAADPAYAPGTGSPEPGGLRSDQLLRAARRVAHEVGIVGMDLVEVSPPYDSATTSPHCSATDAARGNYRARDAARRDHREQLPGPARGRRPAADARGRGPMSGAVDVTKLARDVAPMLGGLAPERGAIERAPSRRRG